MSAGAGPISQRPAPTEASGAGGSSPGGMPPPAAPLGDARLEMLKERLRVIGPWVGYSLFFFVALLFFAYLTFPYQRLRDRIIADFEKSQKVPPGGARQALSIGKLEPSWFTGVVLKDVALTSTPADPGKPSSVLRADEVKVRVSLGSLLSSRKDLTIAAKALGGTIEGTITHVKSATPPKPGDKTGDKYDRTIKLTLEGISLAELAPLSDAVGARVAGTLSGTIDLVMAEERADKANGTISLNIENFGLPGESDADAAEDCKKPETPKPCTDIRVHFKVPELKAMFGKDTIALPAIAIGSLPIVITVKNGVARVEKMAAAGKDLDLTVDGQITLRENTNDSDVNLGLRFKFNDTFKKKNPTAESAVMVMDMVPKLKAAKRVADGSYGLHVSGLLGGALKVDAVPGGGALPGGIPPRPPPGFPTP